MILYFNKYFYGNSTSLYCIYSILYIYIIYYFFNLHILYSIYIVCSNLAVFYCFKNEYYYLQTVNKIYGKYTMYCSISVCFKRWLRSFKRQIRRLAPALFFYFNKIQNTITTTWNTVILYYNSTYSILYILYCTYSIIILCTVRSKKDVQ